MSSLYFDDEGVVFAATDGSLIFFSGIARTAAGVFLGVGNELNIVVETADGPSIFLAELRAVILALESLHFAGHNKIHLIVDSQVCLEVVKSVLEAKDSSSLMTIKRQSGDLTAEIVDTLDRMLSKFLLVKTSKVASHTDRAGLFHYLNSRADFAVTSCLRDKYASNQAAM